MKNTAAVVVTYNRKELLKQNIGCLLSQRPHVPEIFVVDNHSTDGTREALGAYIQKGCIRYFDTGANLGGAGGFQYGIRKAMEAGFEYLWLMDDDCMPHSDALEMFLRADARLNGNYGFLSGKVLWTDGSLCQMTLQRHPLTRNIRDFEPELVPATLASFVSLFLRRDVVMQMGLPIREFFIWTDDWEYTRRISRQYPCYVATRSIAVHHSKTNCGAQIARDSVERLERYRYLYRNDVYPYRREGIRGFAYEAVRLSVHLLRVILIGRDHRIERAMTILQGTREGLRFHPTIEYVKERGL